MISCVLQVLKRGGYYTAALGKWHLGHFTQEYTPHGRGYDYYFGFLLGSETHDTHNSWGRHTCNIPVTDLYNCSRPANDSVHYHNLTCVYPHTHTYTPYSTLAT